MSRPAEDPRVLLVETHPALPGLLPFQAWDALARATEIYVRDVDAHPSAQYLWFAGMDLVTLQPAALDRADLDLTRPGSPEDRRLAKALLARAGEVGEVAYLLGEDDTTLAKVVGVESARYGAEVEFVFLVPSPDGAGTVRLADVMRRLRDPDDGCPWDLEQDHTRLGPYLVEETHELLDAIAAGDDAAIREELGDVLLQVVFHAQVARDRGAFDLDDVARGIVDKLVRRHPHVFADADAATADDVQTSWDEIKRREKVAANDAAEDAGLGGPFDGIPSGMPPLAAAAKVLGRAQRQGFSWSSPGGAIAKLAEELDELAAVEPSDEEARRHELGDVLLAAVAFARHHGMDADDALRRAVRRFRVRYEQLAADLAGTGATPSDLDEPALLEAWEVAKRTVAPGDAAD